MKKDNIDLIFNDLRNKSITEDQAHIRSLILITNINTSERDMWSMLKEINDIMWNGPMIKDRGLKEIDITKIMDVLLRWSSKF